MFFAPIFNGHHTINPERLSISLVSRLISFFDNDVNPASSDGENVKSVVEMEFSMLSSLILEVLPATSGRTRVGFRVANFGSGACRDALTRSLSSTARRPSLLSLQVFRYQRLCHYGVEMQSVMLVFVTVVLKLQLTLAYCLSGRPSSTSKP